MAEHLLISSTCLRGTKRGQLIRVGVEAGEDGGERRGGGKPNQPASHSDVRACDSGDT